MKCLNIKYEAIKQKFTSAGKALRMKKIALSSLKALFLAF